MQSKILSKVKTFTNPVATSKLTPPESTDSHFFVAGRYITFFPCLTYNGFTLLSEDCPEDTVKTLLGSVSDLDHLKLGYGAKSEVVGSTNNSSCGSVIEALRHDDGIDVVCKIERTIVKSLGFTSEDFEPGKGIFSSFSQESDFLPQDGKFLVLDKDDLTKIKKTLSYSEGLELGYINEKNMPIVSRYNGRQWDYVTYHQDPIFFAWKPINFTGCGSVVNPADPTAIVYKLAASLGVNPDNDQDLEMNFSDLNPSDKFYEKHGVKGSDDKYHLPLPPKGHPQAKRYAKAVLTRAHQVTKLSPEQVAKQVKKAKDILGEGVSKSTSDFYPGMDSGPSHPESMVWGSLDIDPRTGPQGSDRNVWADDFTTHPDILTADVDKFSGEEDDPKVNDSCYAACYSDVDYNNQEDGKPAVDKKRFFRIKNDKGELDRKRLIAHYRTLTGTRGSLHSVSDIPAGVRLHALAAIRQGLKATNPRLSKEISSMQTNPEIDELNAKMAEYVKTHKLISHEDHVAVVSDRDAKVAELALLTAKITELEETKKTLSSALAEKETALEAVVAKELSSTRIVELEAILPFTDDEKKAEAHGEYVKSLASLTESDFEITKLKRENQALKKVTAGHQKSLASHRPGLPSVNPVPLPDPETSVAWSVENSYL